jgi:hypothetical protein
MPDPLLDDLKQQVSTRNAVAIVGAGVSILATGRALLFLDRIAARRRRSLCRAVSGPSG